jgi:hypothetical protein
LLTEDFEPQVSKLLILIYNVWFCNCFLLSIFCVYLIAKPFLVDSSLCVMDETNFIQNYKSFYAYKPDFSINQRLVNEL